MYIMYAQLISEYESLAAAETVLRVNIEQMPKVHETFQSALDALTSYGQVPKGVCLTISEA
jgi:hypothetical protein